MDSHNPTMAAGTGDALTSVAAGAKSLAEIRDERERRASARRRRRLRQRRLRRLLLVLLVFLVPILGLGAIHRRPVKVTVGDRSVWAWGSRSIAYAVGKARSDLPRGDLVDVRGRVLRAGAGEPAVPLVGGRPVSYGMTVRECRRVTFERGADRREPVRAEATLLAASSGEEWADPWKPAYLAGATSVAGIDREERGAISGRPYLFGHSLAEPIEARGTRMPRPKRLALTFDDGPNDGTTREVLSILAAGGAHATFFLLGDCVVGQEDVVREMVAAGNEAGNHSWGHPLMTRFTVEEALANIRHAETIIGAASGRRCRWFRPPYGGTNTRLRRAILEAGYNIALWSCDTNDWQRPGADTIYQRIMRGAEPGAIIIVHDGGGPREQTLAAIRRAVPDLVGRGYELVTLSELAASMPTGDAGMILTTGTQTWRAEVPAEPISVYVDGRELSAPGPILVVDGNVLLPAPAILEALGADWDWDTAGQVLTIHSLRGTFRFRLNSPLVSWDDREVHVDVPPMLYHGTPLLPVWALVRAADARLEEQPSPRAYRFVSLAD